VTGYVLDDLVLTAGLAGTGREHHRRELSRLLHGAIAGGPTLDVPAHAQATGQPLLTTDPHRYAEIPVDVLTL
jgi:hypothetical protein